MGSRSTLGGWEGLFSAAARYLLSWGLQQQSAGQTEGFYQVARSWDHSTRGQCAPRLWPSGLLGPAHTLCTGVTATQVSCLSGCCWRAWGWGEEISTGS